MWALRVYAHSNPPPLALKLAEGESWRRPFGNATDSVPDSVECYRGLGFRVWDVNVQATCTSPDVKVGLLAFEDLDCRVQGRLELTACWLHELMYRG